MDRYNLTARVYPMILFFLPLSALLLVTIWDYRDFYHFSIPVGLLGVLVYLTSHLGRDGGKKKEARLWIQWGGAPTTQLFRWNDDKIDMHTKTRNHKKMESLCPIGYAVDESFELQNQTKADEIYIAWTKFLLGKTRDQNLHSIIFKENMAYGFRRNLWGLKPYAISIIVLLIGTIYGFFVFKTGVWQIDDFPQVFFIAEIFLIIFLLFWLLRVTKSWIKLTAFAYAERLHEAIEGL
ncbi:hypothetical protein [Epilithonimonas hispanica]|uniref:Uncharacterized protein n=1 Tax=Epilithonimonas hispanica TaxID=358687 RepID=A0A3D9CKD1_9FLAO|nr:hypothetical protein [Epilithonimonas hispanica]REC66201.1 hypothetical protein DRF58_17075 [Epilithonimonas hispanica]